MLLLVSSSLIVILIAAHFYFFFFQAGWTKGRLNCPNCEARVGSFDFVSQSTCACGLSVLPAVHVVKSKVDCSSVNSDLLVSLKSETAGNTVNKIFN